MTTCDGETLTFKSPVAVKHAVDKWLLKVVDQMRTSNRFSIKKAILDSGTNVPGDGRVWTDGFPVSVCLIADHVWWTAEVEHVFDEMGAVSAADDRSREHLRVERDVSVSPIRNDAVYPIGRQREHETVFGRAKRENRRNSGPDQKRKDAGKREKEIQFDIDRARPSQGRRRIVYRAQVIGPRNAQRRLRANL